MRHIKHTVGFFLFAFMACGVAISGHAVDPFDNWVNPAGLYLIDYPFYYGSQKLTDKNGHVALGDLNLHNYQNIFRVTYYNNTSFKKPYVFSVYWPVARLDILGGHDFGLGDPNIAGGYFFVDDKVSNLYIGLGVKMDIPLGRYDAKRIANIGTNVWRVKPVLTFAKLWNQVDVEATLRYDIITENKDTQKKDGNKLVFESYGGVFLNSHFLLGVHFNFISGEDDELNGIKVADTRVRQFQAGPNVLWMPTPTVGVMLEIVPDFSTKNTTAGTLFLSRLSWKVK
jgi:hypothetical protein